MDEGHSGTPLVLGRHATEQRGIVDDDEPIAKLQEINNCLVDKVSDPIMGYQFGRYSAQQTYAHNYYLTGRYERPRMDDVWLDSKPPSRQ